MSITNPSSNSSTGTLYSAISESVDLLKINNAPSIEEDTIDFKCFMYMLLLIFKGFEYFLLLNNLKLDPNFFQISTWLIRQNTSSV